MESAGAQMYSRSDNWDGAERGHVFLEPSNRPQGLFLLLFFFFFRGAASGWIFSDWNPFFLFGPDHVPFAEMNEIKVGKCSACRHWTTQVRLNNRQHLNWTHLIGIVIILPHCESVFLDYVSPLGLSFRVLCVLFNKWLLIKAVITSTK